MKQFILILIITGFAALFSSILIYFKPEAGKVVISQPVTEVKVVEVHPQNSRLTLKSQGSIMPVTETDLSVQVSGRVTEVSPNLRAGSFVKKGAPLIRIEDDDYKAVLAMREATLAGARLSLATEEALSDQALQDWKVIGKGKPSSLTLRRPQLEKAKAELKSAIAAVDRARRDLQRTVVRAPYDALVLSKNVNLGQIVSPAATGTIAKIFDPSKGEVRLPLSVEEFLHLNTTEESQSPVTLYRDTPDGRIQWPARLVRVEASIDPASRLIHAIAEMEAPFDQSTADHSLSTKRGLFVRAEIEGRMLKNVYSLPRYALRTAGTVYIVTEQNTLVQRTVRVVKSDAQAVIIDRGLNPGDRVVTSPIAYFAENMAVQVIESK